MRRPRTAGQIREEVAPLLRRCKVKRPPVPVDEIASKLGARVRYLPHQGELAGMLMRHDQEITIGVNSLHHPNRQRFTIAHECGHLILHSRDVHIDRSFRINRDETSSKAVKAEEIEANRFAAELLMPYSMILDDLIETNIDVEDEVQVKELAERYEVSVQAMTLRITNLLDDLIP